MFLPLHHQLKNNEDIIGYWYRIGNCIHNRLHFTKQIFQ